LTSRTSTITTPNHTPKWTRVFEWNGIEVGEPVKVKDERGSFTFNEVHVQEGTVIAVGVYGGIEGNRTTRFFYPDRVTKAPKKRPRKPNFEPDPSEESDDE
jgi:hypothetical protein